MVGADTTFLVDLFRNDRSALGLLEGLRNDGDTVSTTVVNMAELFKGAFLHARTQEKRAEVEELTDVLVVLDMGLESAEYYGEIYAELKRRGDMVSDRDILIASIFLSFGEKRIVTRDVEHFNRIEGLELLTY